MSTLSVVGETWNPLWEMQQVNTCEMLTKVRVVREPYMLVTFSHVAVTQGVVNLRVNRGPGFETHLHRL